MSRIEGSERRQCPNCGTWHGAFALERPIDALRKDLDDHTSLEASRWPLVWARADRQQDSIEQLRKEHEEHTAALWAEIKDLRAYVEVLKSGFNHRMKALETPELPKDEVQAAYDRGRRDGWAKGYRDASG
jgi:hypothetical protein